MTRRIVMVVAALTLVAAACGDAADGTTTTTSVDEPAATTTAPEEQPAPTTTTTAAAAPTTVAAPAGLVVQVATGALGDHLVDGDGNTLYLFTPDAQGDTSACTGDCAETWPPLAGEAAAGDGADAALLGTITRDDGATQPTYNGWPLYYFAADAAPGDANGQGIGDVWWVIDPAGNAIQ